MMNSIDTDTIIQSIPLCIGALILIIYAIHCKKNKYEFNSEHVYGIIENCIAITAAIVLILAAYSEVFRRYILEFKIYLAVGGVLIAVMACKSLHRIFSNQYLGGRQTSNNSLFREKKDLLIVVDLQRDFCKDGVLETPNADLIIPSIHLASLDELTMPDYDSLAAEAAYAQTAIFTDFSSTPANQNNPDSPLGDLNA